MDLLIPEVSVVEKVLRCTLIYVFLLMAFRLTGKRQLGQMTAFDFIVLMIMSELVQNAMNGEDRSVTGGVVAVTTVLLLNGALSSLTHRFKRAERLVEHPFTILFRHGHVLWDNVHREHMSARDFRSALRQQGVASLKQVRFVLLEQDGRISVIKKSDADT